MTTQQKTKEKIDIRPLFGLTHIKSEVFMEGYSTPGPATPPQNVDYMWVLELLNDMFAFFNSKDIAMQMIGHMGTGKSSFCEEFHARLNLPLYTYNAHPRTTFEDLIGGYCPTKEGGLEFKFGPLGRAALEGCSVMIDEYNVIDPGEATGLNALLEGRSIYIKEIDDWLHPQAGFRVFTTINPKTYGYVGRNTQDAANDDRFSYMYFNYMPEDQEVMLIKNCLMKTSRDMKDEKIAEAMAMRFRLVADSVRKAYMGNSDAADALDITLSTRSLLRWVKQRMLFDGVSRKGYSPVHYALERSKTLKATDQARLAVHAFVQQVFGDAYTTPMNPLVLAQ
jgi:cobaltochelatase CobS